MLKEGWPDQLGRVIGATVSLGILSTIAGVVWGLAVGFDIGTGAMWGGIIGGGIVFIVSLGTLTTHSRELNVKRSAGMMMMFGGLGVIAVVIGLVVWLIRTLLG